MLVKEAPERSYNCSSASNVTLKDIDSSSPSPNIHDSIFSVYSFITDWYKSIDM